MEKRIKKNYVYNLIFQIVSMIVPLITSPYLSRVLQPSGIGRYAYAYSLASYFMIVAGFGFSIYGEREIAAIRDDKQAKSKVFWEITLCKLIVAFACALIMGLLVIVGVFGDYRDVMALLIVDVIAVGFDITYFFAGLELFSKTITRNIIIKLLGLICIFVFVKSKDDLLIYVLVNVCMQIGSSLSLWPFIFKLTTKIPLKDLHIMKHFYPSLKLFLPTLAISLYTTIDKTLIGIFVSGTTTQTESVVVNESVTTVSTVVKNSDLENGYYEQAQKLVGICITIITSLGTVFTPGNAKLYHDKEYSKLANNFYAAARFILFIAPPMAFGLAAVSSNVIPWFFGEGYDKVKILLPINCILIIVQGISSLYWAHYILPTKKDKQYLFIVVSSMIINSVVSIPLILCIQSIGALIGSIIAELINCFLCIFVCRKEISFVTILKMTWRYFVAAAAMGILVYGLSIFLAPSILNSLFLGCLGVLLYFSFVYCLNDFWFLEKAKHFLGLFRKK